jgi:hypothetical protein
MFVIELLLPLKRNDGSDQPARLFGEVRQELLDRFGGLTAFTRAPAEGLWESGGEGAGRDEIVVFEVMADALDRGWWADYRAGLERRFEQQELAVRATAAERL